MNRNFGRVIGRTCVLGVLVLSVSSGSTQEKRHRIYKSVCTVPHPESICTSSNTCGSDGGACSVDVKRTASSAAAVASVADAKDNAPFCVKAGTKVTWQSLSKNTGFVIDLGSSSPF